MGKRMGDRKDGKLLRNLDSMHFIMPIIYPGRCNNEAFISERIDLTKTMAYIDKKNLQEDTYNYTLFHVVLAATLKTLTLRPKMNRFIKNGNIYQRNEISAAFVVKKIFSDDGEEGLAFIHSKDDDTLDSIHDEILRQISECRSEDTVDASTEAMDFFNKMPRFLAKFLVKRFLFLDRHGLIPQSVIETDPYHASVVLSNLGSIGLKACYHHLTDWGTNSVFVAIGERKYRAFIDEYGNGEMRDSVDIGLTIDERIADGYYYSGTVRLLKKLIENPELLELSFDRKIEY